MKKIIEYDFFNIFIYGNKSGKKLVKSTDKSTVKSTIEYGRVRSSTVKFGTNFITLNKFHKNRLLESNLRSPFKFGARVEFR